MAYQIKHLNGYEIQYATGSNKARVSDRNNQIVFEGTARQCEKWLKDRACYRRAK